MRRRNYELKYSSPIIEGSIILGCISYFSHDVLTIEEEDVDVTSDSPN